MDCNKEEAIRAKGIAERKMQNDDFEGARKIVRKAQQLFPELENIYQLLTVCDVHCSAQIKICGSEMNWYGILQVERLADEVTIKKQYRKLALALHPDKNKFPGAESAFKLIGEAHMVLSDQGKRSLYDNKCRVSMRKTATKPPPPQFNQNPSDRKQNMSTQPQPSSTSGQQTFWTSCPFCSMRYQYYRDFVNRALRCQKCVKPFIAYDLGAYGVPPGSNFDKPAFPQQNQSQSQGFCKVGSQSTGGFPPPQMRPQGSFNSKTVQSEPVSRTGTNAEVDGGSMTKDKDWCDQGGGKERVGSANVDAVKPKESGTSRNTMRKRRRKLVVESSESCDTATSADTEDDVIIPENSGDSAGGNSGLNDVHPRRSFRKRRHVSYNESLGGDDNIVNHLKRSSGNGSVGDSKEELKGENVNNGVSKTENSSGFTADREDTQRKRNSHLGRSFLNKSGKDAEHDVNEVEGDMAGHDAKTCEVIDDTESDSDSTCAPDSVFYECPDPEFNDFDKDRGENCFATDQIWACYDTKDGMPRFYARVRKVFSPGFRLRITWLEPHPEDQAEINWINEDLPFSCGKFVQGNTDDTTDRLTFSHQIYCEKGSGRCSYIIYPRKRETWALFKDWNICWSSDPENHKMDKFEIVEVISDFDEDAGVWVACLDKVKGFVSVFRQTTRKGIVSFLIPPSELLRFSHRIPSFKLMGTEKDGIPKGSLELDPASLPTNFYECVDMKMGADSLDVKANDSNLRSPEKGVKAMSSAEKLNIPDKCVRFEGKNDPEKETFILRRSPRKLDNKDKKPNQMNASQCPTQGGIGKDLDSGKNEKCVDFTPSKGSSPSSCGDEKIKLPMKNASPQSCEKIPNISQSFSLGGKILEVFHNFNGDKSEGKFKLHQIWALYNEDGLPKNYAQVKKIKSDPFILHVDMLEECTISKDRAQTVCCGTFKLQTGKARVFSPSSFSHLVRPECIGKNEFKIFPRVGEVWALYKDWNADASCSDLKKGKYQIVEVFEENGNCMKVSFLIQLNGFKSVFKTPRRQRSSSVMEIPLVELARFSHQIPSFKLTDEKNGLLRGCWELDPAAIPEVCT
ncbi:DnaJ subfamily B member like [Actinidia chinensis var. chinensis]|uniref:DnaJ subfamily B member like n=1 Tax=Actinidia chinensis var. chinensis TaxID=1590841 RepID=A0A2R6RBF5_ACTCC|nr:DnaJ subfamily B member like [Actinidia chinensis var. chinensis]